MRCREKSRSFQEQHKDCDPSEIPIYGQVIDMIKDSYEMEKDCYKGLYYELAALRMCHEMNEVPNERAGYDHWRTSTGRFAPKGTGHYSAGYHPMPNPESEMMPHDMRGDIWYNDRAGMPTTRMTTKITGRYGYPMDERHDRAYNDFNDARRYYHETKSPEAKKEMDEHGMEHVKEVIETSKDIYKEASPEMKRKLKEEFTKMMADLGSA